VNRVKNNLLYEFLNGRKKMVTIILAVFLIVIGIIVPRIFDKEKFKVFGGSFTYITIGLALYFILASSFVIIDADKVGHLNRIYLGKPMPTGQIIALDGQKGPQADTLPPGFTFVPFLKILYDVEELPVVEIPEGHYGFILAKDGIPLRPNQYMANAWPEGKLKNMLIAERFLKGNGQKGPQLTVLPPGKYRINHYLFHIETQQATDIPAGFVGVVRSNIQESVNWETADVPKGIEGSLSVPLVKKGSVGIWDEAMPPGRYYLNRKAYIVTLIDTRVHILDYKGGYRHRFIDLEITQDGKTKQKERSETVEVPKYAADSAVFTRMEGWLVPHELRVQVQVKPEHASFLVASVGDLKAVESTVITPSLRSVVRNVCSAEKVTHLIDEHRAAVEEKIEKALIPEGMKAGVSIEDVRLVASMIPPELLVVRMREQLASQLKDTFIREKESQEQRIQTEKARATAEQQPKLVAAEIRVKIAEKDRLADKLKGEGEKLKLIEIAAGQKVQASVLGKEKVMELAVLDKILSAAVNNPEIVKVPHILVSGSGSGLEGAAAILGASNIIKGMPLGHKTEDVRLP
jgi:regulator of protease activity HflC (stomatin/prohibitin superfamily)